MITVKKLSKIYPNEVMAVEDVSFELKKGETLAIIGSSGCGKTTLLKMINRLIDPTSGKVFIDEKDHNSLDANKLRRTIGYVIQDIGLFPHYTVQKNVEVVPRLLKWAQPRIQEKAAEMLDLVGLPFSEFGHRFPNELSGGQQQRVGIARALVSEPSLLLLDEPFGALDPITREEIQREFLTLKRHFNTTNILVTHDMGEAVLLADKIILMNKGKVMQQGSPLDLLLRPENDFADDFFKKHRFSLLMKKVRISDILERIPDSEAHHSSGMTLDINSSVEAALTHAGALNQPVFIESEGKLLKQTEKGNILAAFYEFNFK